MNKYETGIKHLTTTHGKEGAKRVVQRFNKISEKFTHYITDVAYGDFYDQDLLSPKIKELAGVACLIGQGNFENPLKDHLKAMLNVGWKKEEIIDLLIFLTAYKGFPSTTTAIKMLHSITED